MKYYWIRAKYFFYDFLRFFKNIWRFRKELWEHGTWDYTHSLSMLKRSLELLLEDIKNGGEYEDTLNKKIYYIKRTIYLLDCIIEEKHIGLAEERLKTNLITKKLEFIPSNSLIDGKPCYELVNNLTPQEKSINNQIYKESHIIEKEIWEELMDILKGGHFKADIDSNPSFYKNKSYEDYQNGKGMREWWW